MTRHGVPITEHLIPSKIDTGIGVEQFIPGFVPLYEQLEACIFGNYNWDQWFELSHVERVYCIAQYRMHSMIERHVQQAVNKYMEQSRGEQ